MMPRTKLAVVKALGAALAAAAIAQMLAPHAATARPNVVVVMTDDQTLGQMRALPETERLIGGAGTAFTKFYVTQPQCCPSRASYLTGQYPHNTGVRDNDKAMKRFRDRRALPVWLDRAGYRTMLVGKYLNGYGPRRAGYVPPGWDQWAARLEDAKMYDYDLSQDGRVVHYGRRPRDYATDVFARKARRFVAEAASDRKKFYLHVSATAPHFEGSEAVGNDRCSQDPRPAPRHDGDFSDEPLPKPPSYDEADVSDKPAFIRRLSRIGPDRERCLMNRWQSALESLLSVDDMVSGLVRELQRARQLDDTLFIFTSDNGFFFGEHRFTKGKNQFYEPATRMPLLIRGPGFPAGATRDQLTGNIDLAPTILDFTGARESRRHRIDGRPLTPLASDPTRGRGRDLLIESAERYVSLRTDRWLFSSNLNAENQLYDMSADPYQLDSIHVGGPPFQDLTPERQAEVTALQQGLADRLRELKSCEGAGCR